MVHSSHATVHFHLSGVKLADQVVFVGHSSTLAEMSNASNTNRSGGRKADARTFGQDLMRGEHKVGETASNKNGLTHGTTVHPYDGAESPSTQSGTSIFDPVLCELVYRWFCPVGGSILDPFAGGSVRGIVASRLGRHYTGIDLATAQLAANERQRGICGHPQPKWLNGNALDARTLAPGNYDLVFSCPPYGDLERYSDDPADISTMQWGEFLKAYRAIVAVCIGMLKPDRFACFVVGDIRDAKGIYRNFVGETVRAFTDAGAKLYNEAILITAVGSLPIRAGKQFASSRKLGKTHQNVLVFVKGDPKQATAEIGPVECGDVPEDGFAA